MNQVYNVAVGERTSLNDLYGLIRDGLAASHESLVTAQPTYREFRAGDVRHSLADIGKVAQHLGYQPSATLSTGLAVALPWYLKGVK